MIVKYNSKYYRRVLFIILLENNIQIVGCLLSYITSILNIFFVLLSYAFESIWIMMAQHWAKLMNVDM